MHLSMPRLCKHLSSDCFKLFQIHYELFYVFQKTKVTLVKIIVLYQAVIKLLCFNFAVRWDLSYQFAELNSHLQCEIMS